VCNPIPIFQEIVPDELMEIYLSMNETAKAQNVDTDLPYYCAYSLPGVALTLGKGHWPMLKPTFDVLAADMHVRMTIW
jgi:serine/threonine-protein phosphatase 4 regulatory subunit 1